MAASRSTRQSGLDERLGNLFRESLSRIFDSWTALQIAVQQGFGGAESKEKAVWMVGALETWFRENAGVETYEVEDLLEDILNEEFDLRVEDNSLQEIANLICSSYKMCQENRVEELQQKMASLPKASLQGCQMSHEEVEEMDSDEESSPNVSAQGASASASSSSLPPTDQDVEMDAEEAQDLDDGWQKIRRSRRKR